MNDSRLKEDADAVAEGETVTSHFEQEVSKHSVDFSESQMSATQEFVQIHEFDTSSVISEEEEKGAVVLNESEEDLKCEKGFYSDVEKEAVDSKQAEVEISVIPPSPPLHLHEQEKEAQGVEEKTRASKPLRKLSGEYHNSYIDHEFPALIRCFQVVNVNSKYLSVQSPLLHFLESIRKHCSKHMPQIPSKGLGSDGLKLFPKLISYFNLLQSVQMISPSSPCIK